MKEEAYPTITVVITLALWELVSRLGIVNPFLLPAPTLIGINLLYLLGENSFYIHLVATLMRVLVGLLLAIIIGLLMGLFIGTSKLGSRTARPLVLFTNPVPKIMMLPVLVVFFGIGNLPKVLLIFLASVYPVIFNVWHAAKSIPLIYFEVSGVLKLNRFMELKHIVIPAVMPALFAAIKVSIGISLIIVFFAESFATETGIGFFVIRAWELFAMKDVFTGIVVMSILGFCLVNLTAVIEKRVLAWEDVRR